MQIWSLHGVELAIVVVYLLGMIWLGKCEGRLADDVRALGALVAAGGEVGGDST